MIINKLLVSLGTSDVIVFWPLEQCGLQWVRSFIQVIGKDVGECFVAVSVWTERSLASRFQPIITIDIAKPKDATAGIKGLLGKLSAL